VRASSLQVEYERLKKLGGKFQGEPTKMESIAAVVSEDTCGNLISLLQPVGSEKPECKESLKNDAVRG
jgi:hypothetical protein